MIRATLLACLESRKAVLCDRRLLCSAAEPAQHNSQPQQGSGAIARCVLAPDWLQPCAEDDRKVYALPELSQHQPC